MQIQITSGPHQDNSTLNNNVGCKRYTDIFLEFSEVLFEVTQLLYIVYKILNTIAVYW